MMRTLATLRSAEARTPGSMIGVIGVKISRSKTCMMGTIWNSIWRPYICECESENKGIFDASFGAFMAAMFQVEVFWVVTSCSVVL
jgi:hypothetical protein